MKSHPENSGGNEEQRLSFGLLSRPSADRIRGKALIPPTDTDVLDIIYANVGLIMCVFVTVQPRPGPGVCRLRLSYW